MLGLKPDQATKLKSVPVPDLIAAQGELARLEKKFANALAPFWPVVDGEIFRSDVAPALKAGAGATSTP